MQVNEIIQEIRKTQPKLLEGIDDKSADELIRRVFTHINESLTSVGEGVVKYAGLGQFRVRKVQKERKGQKVERTRIVFRTIPKEGEEDDGAEE
jgi:nucleoid DNA-binding protein